MSTSEAQYNKAAARQSTFERMLEIEQRSKLERMQTQAYTSGQASQSHNSMAVTGQSSRNSLERRPRTLQQISRAMTTPNLSLSIPATQQINDSTKYIISARGEVIPQSEEKDDDSDASSLCQSPGWDDISGKKRRKEKEKKRKEKELAKAKTELVKMHKSPRKRLSKAPAPMDRTVSVPVVSMAAAAIPKVDIPVEVAQKPAQTRRGSMDMAGLRGFLGGRRAKLTPWRTSTAPVTPAAEIPPMPTAILTADSGFVGGMRLRQSMDANTQEETSRRLKMEMEQDEITRQIEQESELKLAANSSRNSFSESLAPVSIYEEHSRTSKQWDSIYTQAALIAAGDDAIVDEDDTPMMDRNIRKGRRSHPPTSKYFENEAAKSRRDLSQASSRISFPSDSQDSMDSSPLSIPIQHPEDSAYMSSNSLTHSRQQSQDHLVSDAESAYAVGGASRPRKSESRGRSIFGRSRSRSRNPSESRPTTADRGRDGAINPVLREDPSSQLLSGQNVKSPVDTAFKNHRNSSFATSGVKGLRNAARAAFFKNSIPIHSGSDSHSSAEVLTARPQTGKRATADITTLKKGPSKLERVFGEPIPAELSPKLPSHSKYASHLRHNDGPSHSSSSSSQINWAHSRSSSDDYSTPDEYSNITTPTGSRPHSHKENSAQKENSYLPHSDNGASRSKMNMSTGNIHQPKPAYLMSGAIPSDESLHSGREDWAQSALPIQIPADSTDEERGGTPQKSGVTVGTAKGTVQGQGVSRQASLSRSISNPELHDLSFLPKLKHQPLAPRPQEKSQDRRKEKEKNRDDMMGSHNGRIVSGSSSLSEPLSSPLPLPSFSASQNQNQKSRSENGSPTSPLSSQYLKNARLAIPKKSSYSNGNQGGQEPIAKMFVVCCSCKYFHDMPSKIYQCMAQPDNVVRDSARGVQGVVSTAVKCPWCGHGMSTRCCEGYAAVVVLRERLH